MNRENEVKQTQIDSVVTNKTEIKLPWEVYNKNFDINTKKTIQSKYNKTFWQ